MQKMTMAVGLSVSSMAYAGQVAYDSFGPGDTYLVETGYSIAGPEAGSPFGEVSVGVRFESVATGALQQIEAAFGYLAGTEGATVELWDASTNGSEIGSNLLGSWSVTGGLGDFSSVSPPVVFDASGSGVMLESGSLYWLIPRATGDTRFSWHTLEFSLSPDPANRVPMVELKSGDEPGYASQTPGAFRVTVPTPGVGLGMVGGLLLMGRRRR